MLLGEITRGIFSLLREDPEEISRYLEKSPDEVSGSLEKFPAEYSRYLGESLRKLFTSVVVLDS